MKLVPETPEDSITRVSKSGLLALYSLLKTLAVPPLATAAPRTSTRIKRQTQLSFSPLSFFLTGCLHIYITLPAFSFFISSALATFQN
jgi:hypothetical protein